MKEDQTPLDKKEDDTCFHFNRPKLTSSSIVKKTLNDSLSDEKMTFHSSVYDTLRTISELESRSRFEEPGVEKLLATLEEEKKIVPVAILRRHHSINNQFLGIP